MLKGGGGAGNNHNTGGAGVPNKKGGMPFMNIAAIDEVAMIQDHS